jgi:glycerol kinase
VPALTGLGAPWWEPRARGAILGLTRGSTAAHIARATLEGIAFQVADLLGAVAADAGVSPAEIRADGGVARNDLMLQFQADVLATPVTRAAQTESTALGAALLAGLAAGVWSSQDEATAVWRSERTFDPEEGVDREALLKGWAAAVACVRDLAGRGA